MEPFLITCTLGQMGPDPLHFSRIDKNENHSTPFCKTTGSNKQMMQIATFDELTDEFILVITDELFATTIAYRAFANKQLFIGKIKDKHVRYNMMKNIIALNSVEE